ncbi:MAG: rhodanese-like domain-containing protein [Flavobacteriales bacterium]
MTTDELKKQAEKISLIDIREAYEFETIHIPNSVNMPMDQAAESPSSIPENALLICQSGRRANSLQFILKTRHNRADLQVLEGGVNDYFQL